MSFLSTHNIANKCSEWLAISLVSVSEHVTILIFFCTDFLDCYSQQHQVTMCIMEPRTGLHCMWRREWSPESTQAGNTDKYYWNIISFLTILLVLMIGTSALFCFCFYVISSQTIRLTKSHSWYGLQEDKIIKCIENKATAIHLSVIFPPGLYTPGSGTTSVKY